MTYQGLRIDQCSHSFIGVMCETCSLRPDCTTTSYRRISVSEDYALRREAKAFNQTQEFKDLYRQRNCVERVIGEAKRFHGMVRAKFRCRWKLRIQFFLTAIPINLKRIAKFFSSHMPMVSLRALKFSKNQRKWETLH